MQICDSTECGNNGDYYIEKAYKFFACCGSETVLAIIWNKNAILQLLTSIDSFHNKFTRSLGSLKRNCIKSYSRQIFNLHFHRIHFTVNDLLTLARVRRIDKNSIFDRPCDYM